MEKSSVLESGSEKYSLHTHIQSRSATYKLLPHCIILYEVYKCKEDGVHLQYLEEMRDSITNGRKPKHVANKQHPNSDGPVKSDVSLVRGR